MAKKIKSPEELRLLRKWLKSETDLRSGPKELEIAVHMGTCGIASGARDVLGELADELVQTEKEDVTLRQSGCRGLCDQEPMLTIKDKSGQEYCYGRLDKSKLHEIVEQHVLQGNPVVEYLVKTEQ